MEIKIKNNDILWMYGAKIFQFASGLFVLPFILKQLSIEEIALWYIFQAIMSFVYLLDFGLLPNISRQCSYIFSGSTELIKEGISYSTNNYVDYDLLNRFVLSVKSIYKYLSIFGFIILISIGSVYVYNLSNSIPNEISLISWMIFSISASFSLYSYYLVPLLNGQGKLMESSKSTVYSKVIYIILTYLLLSNGFGLLGVSLAYLISSLINQLLSRIYFYNNNYKSNVKDFHNKADKKIFSILWFNSRKMGIISLSYFFMTRATIILIGSYLPSTEVAMYGVTLQLIDIIVSISVTTFSVVNPKLSMFVIKKQDSNFLSYSGLVLFISLSSFTIGSLFIIFFGNDIFNILNIKISLLNRFLIVLLSIDKLLHINYSIINQIISTRNFVPYTKSAIVTGFMIFSINFIILQFSNFGLIGIIVSPIIIQSLYNYWKWPRTFLKHYNVSYFKLFKSGFGIIITKFKYLF